MRIVLAALSALFAASALGQGLNDPTRPPPSVLAAQAKLAAGQTGTAVTAPGEDAGVRLQMLNPTQQYAIISGKVVKLGGMVDGAKLVEIRPDAVVLQSPEGVKDTISLYPGVRIRLVTAPQGGESPGKAKVREDAPSDASKKDKR